MYMETYRTVREMQSYSEKCRAAGGIVGFVPTMGFLHEGHLSLVDAARERCDVVVVSVYVNPTQFGPGEDLDRYPRDFERDLALCESRGVDAVFAPGTEEIYAENASTTVVEEKLSRPLCGKSRPGHFRGVTTIVAKLFNAVLPHIAFFGMKDYQQSLVVRRMARDLNFPVDIVICPIIREKDGLAMSSRNENLSDRERINATSIYSALSDAAAAVRKNREKSARLVRDEIRGRIESGGGRTDYVETVDSETLEPVEDFKDGALIAVAVYFGKTRLIDNIVIE